MQFENELLVNAYNLDSKAQFELLNYARRLNQNTIKREKYRREAIKQIKEALESQA